VADVELQPGKRYRIVTTGGERVGIYGGVAGLEWPQSEPPWIDTPLTFASPETGLPFLVEWDKIESIVATD
jgi:hypothetical protein